MESRSVVLADCPHPTLTRSRAPLFCRPSGPSVPRRVSWPKWWIICGSFDESLCPNLGFAGDHIADKPNTHTIPHQSEPTRRAPHCRQATPCTPCNVPSSTPRPKSAHDHIADSEQPEAVSEPQLITSLSHTRPNLIFVSI